MEGLVIVRRFAKIFPSVLGGILLVATYLSINSEEPILAVMSIILAIFFLIMSWSWVDDT